jgi:hypothetical protein
MVMNMGEDTIIYISKDSLKKMVANFDTDLLLWLLERVEGIRWYRFLEHLKMDEWDVKQLTSSAILTYLAMTEKKIDWRHDLVEICKQYDLIFVSDYHRFTPPEGYISLSKIRERIEQLLIEIVEEKENVT